MITLRRPTTKQLQLYLQQQELLAFSYPNPGSTNDVAPIPGYKHIHRRIQLGTGIETYRKAVDAIRAGTMANLGWVQPLVPPQNPSAEQPFHTLAGLLGLWFSNPGRIVYTAEEQTPLHRFGFAFGTLPGHIMRGEESFFVEWNPDDDTVWYELQSFSRPRHWLTWLTLPLVRRYQTYFGDESLRHMKQACQAPNDSASSH